MLRHLCNLSAQEGFIIGFSYIASMLQLTLNDLQLRPPPQMLWIKRHYCPLMLEAMEKAKDSVISELGKKYLAFLWSSAGTSLAYRVNWDASISMHGDEMEMNEIHVPVRFYFPNSNIIEHNEKTQGVNVALDDIHLIPYLFKIAEVKVKRSDMEHTYAEKAGQSISPWTAKKAIVVVPEHWRKLRTIGVVDPRGLYSA